MEVGGRLDPFVCPIHKHTELDDTGDVNEVKVVTEEMGAVCFFRGKMSAVCGPHLQTSFVEEVDQTPARRAFGGCHQPHRSNPPSTISDLPPTPPFQPTVDHLRYSTTAAHLKTRVRSPMAASDDFPAQPLHLRRRRRGGANPHGGEEVEQTLTAARRNLGRSTWPRAVGVEVGHER
ncbi:hypothetical protein E3N88_18139 [Mikania micrantha]|uniref:Uncharacterized protein n=1 Tax=Mikania micrantha TaxID=192012 RepID=A0A5N6NVM1_9ASTR|nr:hypothetical protein E3N88_18139 [Mikania micrantha]